MESVQFPPKPPPSRLLREGCGVLCHVCGSSVVRRWLIIGPRKCIQPECSESGRGGGSGG